jgi:hypothetical protein
MVTNDFQLFTKELLEFMGLPGFLNITVINKRRMNCIKCEYLIGSGMPSYPTFAFPIRFPCRD